MQEPTPTNSRPYHYPSPNTNPKPTNNVPILPNPKPPNPPPKSHPVKNITRTEMQLRREKGLCYYCDDKFSPTHKCPNSHYFVFQVEDDDTAQAIENNDSAIPDSYIVDDSEHHLSLNALNGSHGTGTMRFQGRIQGVAITVLLDSGSSDDFLQPRIANYLQPPIESTAQFPVLVGNGNSLTTMGYIVDLPVGVQGNTLHLPVYLLPITGADLDTFITLYGDQPKGPRHAQFHHIKRLHNTHSIEASFTLQFQKIEPSSTSAPTELHPDLATIVTTFYDIFDEPKGLPPLRFQDHTIPLLEGSNPFKVRPYRYPHSQKAQIEKMVAEMLEQGIIQPT
ncbi:hypothetical protein KIW84_061712 [Lathyrus oleraceus]|uniref:Uncharacterized protein n=1 Tax=Pisum sativum TaxID=3888 RepID=A0A9D5A5J6_PEA|nr:hypothetical protein KIW84_061712 [Pisum sativum]